VKLIGKWISLFFFYLEAFLLDRFGRAGLDGGAGILQKIQGFLLFDSTSSRSGQALRSE
jgi:hypothetical protein